VWVKMWVNGLTHTPNRRRKLQIARFPAGGKTYSFRCVSSPHATRCAGLARGPHRESTGKCYVGFGGHFIVCHAEFEKRILVSQQQSRLRLKPALLAYFFAYCDAVFAYRCVLHGLGHDLAHGERRGILRLSGGVGVGAKREPCVVVPQHGRDGFYIHAIL
jgi:hypothetical protein